MAQNVVTCLYQTKLAVASYVVAVTWCKNLTGQCLSVNIDDHTSQCSCKVDMKPWSFWKKKGVKAVEVGETKMEVFWDLSAAKYGSGPEPMESYCLAVSTDQEVVLLLGDMCREAYRKTIASKPISTKTVLVSRREHIYGKRFYSTKAQFRESGSMHEIMIECHPGGQREPKLYVRVDRQTVLQVKRLMWKFRGNHTIIVDGLPVELFWDVHNWLFNPNDAHGVFMFQTYLSADKSWSKVASGTSLLQWQQADKSKETYGQGPAFSFLIYAWKSE